jgi:hypothetical protein
MVYEIVKNSLPLMRPEVSLPRLQESLTGDYAES